MALIRNFIRHIKPIGIFADSLLLVFVLGTLVNYDFEADLAPMSVVLIVQLGLLWFVCRIALYLFPVLSNYISYIVLLLGVMEAFWGLGQLYNILPSNHVLFKPTGSFPNPGPYGGFISLMFPLALHYWFVYRRENRLLKHLFSAIAIVLTLILPATLSRTAWLAAIVGCGLVVLCHTSILERVKSLSTEYPCKAILIFVVSISLVVGGLFGVFHLKKDSADGRIFMWKVTTLAIRESPVQGVGLGGFPEAYATAQANYFKSEKGSEVEKKVAGSPEYAFNEYLQIFLEQGLVGGLTFLLLSLLIIINGVRRNQVGSSGLFLSLSVFAFASYPYHFWEFLVLWVLFGTICSSGETRSNTIDAKSGTFFSISLVFLVACILYGQKQLQPYLQATSEWKNARSFYMTKSYDKVVDEYQNLYILLKYNPKFVFEYAVALNAVKEFDDADKVLSRGLQLSCDPMFYNVKGRNYYEMGKYDEAEECLLNSIYLLPERIYPYFLLTKLYADPANYQPEKLEYAASVVLTKKPKVDSTAIREMRSEVKKILRRKEESNE